MMLAPIALVLQIVTGMAGQWVRPPLSPSVPRRPRVKGQHQAIAQTEVREGVLAVVLALSCDASARSHRLWSLRPSHVSAREACLQTGKTLPTGREYERMQSALPCRG